MRENRLRRFGHVMRRERMGAVRVVMRMDFEGRSEEEERRLLDANENDTRAAESVCIGHRNERRSRTRVANLKYSGGRRKRRRDEFTAIPKKRNQQRRQK